MTMGNARSSRATARRAGCAITMGAALVGGLVAGCTSSSHTTSHTLTARQVAERYGYDESAPTVSPVYALIPGFHDVRDGYARDLLARQCLDGVTDYRVVPPATTPGTTDARTGQIIFNEQIATQSGYPNLRLGAPAASGIAEGVTVTPAIQDAMKTCGDKTSARLGSPPEREPNDIESAGWTAASTDVDVVKATTAWKTCMAPAGLIDLPASPNEMPPPSIIGLSHKQVEKLGWIPLDASSAVPDREREVAVLDAQCRAKVDYEGAVSRARAEAELTAIGKDIQGFEASRTAYEAYEKKLDAVITELG